MKPHKPADLRELSDAELVALLDEKKETLAKQKFQHALKQLHDIAYLRILKKDIARIKTILTQRQNEKVD